MSQGEPGFSTFYLFATGIAAGIAATLPLVPAAFIGRRYFILMSTVAIVFLSLAIATGGLNATYWHLAAAAGLIGCNVLLPPQVGVDRSARRSPAGPGATVLWQRLAIAMAVMAGASGVAGVAVDATDLAGLLGFSPATSLWLAASCIAAALVLGCAANTMVLGHWYLVVRNPSFTPLARMTVTLLACLAARTVIAAGAAWSQAEQWTGLFADGAVAFLLGTGLFIAARWVFGLVLPLGMAWMTWRCVSLRSNQSATGILYVLLAFLLMGEIIAKYFLLSERWIL